MLWQSMVLQCKSRMGGAFGASGTRVPPIVNPAQSVRREWGGGGARGSPKVKVEGLGYWGWDVVIFKLFIYNITV